MVSANPLFSWLRGLDLNQRRLGYEYNTAMPGNPLILREKRSTARSSTFSVDASFLLLFRPVSGCYGSKMGAGRARCIRHEPAPAVRCPFHGLSPTSRPSLVTRAYYRR